MKTSIEVTLQPMNAIEVVSQAPPEISINAAPGTALEVSLATIGPKGEKGDPGETIGVETVVGNPETNYVTMYQISKLL